MNKGQANQMGISDRDYMREPAKDIKAGKPRAHIKKAENKPSVAERIKFWLWNLKNGK
ncbi:MAG: hypothetical protein V3V05_00890 [Pontiella sp.]